MKKIIESELISIAHRILKLKDKADVESLYNESKNLFEKISILKFYEENKFRIDPSITEENLEKALFNFEEQQANIDMSNVKEISFDDAAMNLDLINELIEESENSDIVPFDEPVSFEKEELNVEETDDIEPEIENLIEDEVEEVSNFSIEDEIEYDIEEEDELDSLNFEEITISEFEAHEALNNEIKNVVEIDPIFSLPIDEIFVEKPVEEIEETIQKLIPENERFQNFENQHLLDVSEGHEIPFHEIPLNKTINDAFSHTITVGLNDRIAFEKNLFNGNSEDLNRVISQLNTIDSYQEALDFIEDLVKPDSN